MIFLYARRLLPLVSFSLKSVETAVAQKLMIKWSKPYWFVDLEGVKKLNGEKKKKQQPNKWRGKTEMQLKQFNNKFRTTRYKWSEKSAYMEYLFGRIDYHLMILVRSSEKTYTNTHTHGAH